MMFSNTAITVENDAKIIKRKKSVPKTLPPGMLLKMDDSVVKRKLAPTVPASAVTPPLNVKHAGKMMRPDIIATKVSKHTMVIDSPRRRRSLPM